jgi:hypothetical protein
MLPYLFLVVAVAVRFLPHPWMFTPVAASLLFFGARGARRQLWVPWVALAASDVVLTKIVYSYPFSWDHYVTWIWYAAVIWLGTNLRENSKPLRVIASALGSSASFFLLSNLAAWAAWRDLYPRTLGGVIESYVAGLPFLRNTVEGDLLFTIAMFSAPVVVHFLVGAFGKEGDPRAAV